MPATLAEAIDQSWFANGLTDEIGPLYRSIIERDLEGPCCVVTDERPITTGCSKGFYDTVRKKFRIFALTSLEAQDRARLVFDTYHRQISELQTDPQNGVVFGCRAVSPRDAQIMPLRLPLPINKLFYEACVEFEIRIAFSQTVCS